MGDRSTYLVVGLVMIVLGVGLAVSEGPAAGAAMAIVGVILIGYGVTKSEAGGS